MRFMRFMLLARSTLKTPWGVLSYVIDMDYTDVVQLSMCDPTLRVVGADVDVVVGEIRLTASLTRVDARRARRPAARGEAVGARQLQQRARRPQLHPAVGQPHAVLRQRG